MGNEELTQFLHAVSNDKLREEAEENKSDISAEDVFTSRMKGERLRTEQAKNKLLEEEFEGKKQDREQRKDFAERIFSFLVAYMMVVCFILFLSGITINHFYLSDTVLVTLLGTTTANVIGIFIVVAKYLFPQHKE